MAYYSSYQNAPNWGTAQFQSVTPPPPAYQPQPSWGGADFFRAASGLTDKSVEH